MGVVYRADNTALRTVCGFLMALSATAALPNFLVIAIDDLRWVIPGGRIDTTSDARR